MVSVFVISTPNSSRGVKLIDVLTNSSDFELTVVEAAMLDSFDSPQARRVKTSAEYSRIFYGRPLSPAETGCSDSHNRARELVSTSGYGGVILEDDAQIPDLEKFVNVIDEFIAQNEARPAVLSLYCTYKKRWGMNPDIPFIRMFGKPKLAVGYFLTPAAASILVTTNSPIKYLADWPAAKIPYYVVTSEIVLHDNEAPSTISMRAGFERNRDASRIKAIYSSYKKSGFDLRQVREIHQIIVITAKNYINFKLDRLFGNISE